MQTADRADCADHADYAEWYFFQVNLDLLYFLGLFTFSRVKMPSSLAPGSQKKKRPGSKKFPKKFRPKDSSHFLGVFYICLLGDSKVHFGFAVYEISELDPTNIFTSLPIREREICVTCTAPCKGFDVFNHLSRKPGTVQFARLVELKFSSVPTVFLSKASQITTLLTIWH